MSKNASYHLNQLTITMLSGKGMLKVLILFDKEFLTVMYLQKTPLKGNKRTNPSKVWKSASHYPLPHMVKDTLTKYNVGYTDRNIGRTTLQTGPTNFINKLTNEFEQLSVKWKVILNWMGIGQQCTQFPESGCSRTVVWYFRQLFVWLKWTQHEHSFPSETIELFIVLCLKHA